MQPSQLQSQPQPQRRWRSRMNAHSPAPHDSNNSSNSSQADGTQDDEDSLYLQRGSTTRSPRQSITTPTASSNAHRQIIGNYELGRVLATGDFDCRTRLCTHVTTGVPHVVRIYDKHVLAEAQWMWERVAESIHVLRKLPPNKHVLEIVECFETDTSVYILMNFFPSINLTKLFTDEAARGEFLNRLHLLSRASLRASAAAKEDHFSSGAGSIDVTAHEGGNKRNSSLTATTMTDGISFRQLKDSRSGHHGSGSGSRLEVSDHESAPRAAGCAGAEEEKRGCASIFPDALGSTSVATTAAIQVLASLTPPHVPLALIRVFFEQVVKGLAFLHQHGVAHTGIAPDHLLVSPEGLVRIANMVSACFCAPGKRLHELRGTMHTVAPEVLRGEAYDPFLADAWALGVVFYFMLNRGRYPHDGANTLRHILHGHTRPSRPGLPAVALDLLSRLMQGKPEDRLPVDAVLAHPFFTASLPTVEEEMMTDAAAEELARSGCRRSVFADLVTATNKNNEHDNKMSSLNPKTSDINSNTARGGGDAHNRWSERGTGGGSEDGDAVALAGSWGALQPQSRATIFSANSESNSVVLQSGLGGSFGVLEGVATTTTTTTPAAGNGETVATSGSSSGAPETRDEGDSFIPRRPQGTQPRQAGTPGGDAVNFHSRVMGGFNCGPSLTPRSIAKGRPVWRPELAPSMESLEDLAARVIQHHFRAVLHRRQYKAETRALMKRGQSMYLSISSSVTCDGAPGPAQETSQKRSLLNTSRSSTLPIHAPFLNDSASTTPTKSSHSFHRRDSLSRSPPETNTMQSNPSPSAWKRKASSHNSLRHTVPGGGAAAANTAGSSTSPLPAWRGRLSSSVGYDAAAAAATTEVHSAPSPLRGRVNSSSVTIDTRGSSFLSDKVEQEDEEAKEDDDDDGDKRGATAYLDGSTTHAKDERSKPGRQTDAGWRHPRLDSLTLPSLAARACGVAWANESPTPPSRLQISSSSRTHGHSSARMVSNGAANASLLSQQGRHRSTISAVLSSVAPAGVSFERQRGGSTAAVVSDGEVCPLCHRKPYAIRSIATRPYAATPYQFIKGKFTELLE